MKSLAVVSHSERCKACKYCMHFCPKQAISQGEQTNRSGYHYVVVNEETCIGCGICYTVCPDIVFDIVEK